MTVFALPSPPSSITAQLLLVGIWLGIVIGSAELLKRLITTDPEITRKVVHIGTGNVILLAWWLDVPTWVGIAASVIFSIVTLLSYRYPILSSVSGVGRKSLGTFFYALSIGILIAWFWPLKLPQYAAIGILTMTWGDGLAALIGQRFGRHPYQVWGMKKSWEGSLSMAVVSCLIIYGILWITQGNIMATWVSAVAISVIVSTLEAFSKWGVDNLTVPIASAALGFVFNEFWLT
ncbi:phosphatidate cytidylyltransferase [Acaryochloris sp. 'Moss Beach']|uniref:diacylglycerol/polyprenol kinase family protein n=1 Tax=Acaryochloris sp. 'Moss Beach' TaxID=2740837 RepID=UPI001F3555A4|nr:diacylglycerol/polyprenol kinase family protein [Acaryochloris sp. 'Moss Beach']UJB68391.1 phosphatidate cytidylyltransferase [Acaryochloris sp. 'Moss Beach']